MPGGVTTAFEYTIGNEMTKQSVGGVDTVFAYDDYGRMVSKYVAGVYSAAYSYRYDNRLCGVTSNFPGEGTVSYNYGADGKRRERVTSSGTVKYRWNAAGFNVINEEDSAGLLTRTYIGHTLAHFDGSGGPPYGPYKYYFHDHLGSTRRLRDQDKDSLGQYEYTPYGETYAESGETITRKYALLEWDATAQMHFAPYRYYMPAAGRWITADRLGMVDGPNVYGYARGNPISGWDPRGLWSRETVGEWLCKLLEWIGFPCDDEDPDVPLPTPVGQVVDAACTAVEEIIDETTGMPGVLGPVIEGGLNPDAVHLALEELKYAKQANDLCDGCDSRKYDCQIGGVDEQALKQVRDTAPRAAPEAPGDRAQRLMRQWRCGNR